jgi:hypothetical protein
LDHLCDSLRFVASGIGEWLHDGWRRSCAFGHRRHRTSGATYSGTKRIAAIQTPAGEGGVSGNEVVSRSGSIVPRFAIPSGEKVS